jgi:LysM repeat protein
LPRDLLYQTNAQGEITQRDTVTDNADDDGKINITGPHARYYYFGGVEMGDVSNDGTSNVNYAAAIADHRKVIGGGLFQFGATSGTHVADFDQSYDTINGLTAQSGPSSYTAQSGDTLQSVAQAVWGDSNFWYLIADANGLDSTSTLTAGQTLIIPNRVANSQNTSSTYNVYDPNDAIGNISPTHPPKPVGNNCGAMGAILMAVVAIVVAAVIPGVGAAIAVGLESLGIGATVAGVVGAAAVGAIADTVAQGVGLAVGAVKSFNWGEVGMAALSAGIGGAGSITGGAITDGIVDNALTQGVEVATGMKKSFNWGDVAAAGVSAGVIHGVGEEIGVDPSAPSGDFGNDMLKGLAGAAGLIANAATRTLVNGSDFGDNLMKGLPDVIGQTIGGMIAGAVSAQSQAGSLTPEEQISLPQQQINYQIPNINEDGTVSYTSAQDPLGIGVSQGDTACVAQQPNYPVPVPRPYTGDLNAASAAGYTESEINEHLGNGDYFDANQVGWFNRGIENVIVDAPSAPSAEPTSIPLNMNWDGIGWGANNIRNLAAQKWSVAFMGGFLDRDNGSTANRVIDYQAEFARLNPNTPSAYFTHDDIGGLARWMQTQTANNQQVALVGQSLGGANMAEMSLAFPGKVPLLVTIDPVEGSALVPVAGLATIPQISESVGRWIDVDGAPALTDVAGVWGHLPETLGGNNVEFFDPAYTHGDIGTNMNFLIDNSTLPSVLAWPYTNYNGAGQLYYTQKKP